MKNRPNITTLKICTGIIIIDNTLKEISSKAAADKETKVAQEAHFIIDGWGSREFTKEEKEILELLRSLEENSYPNSEID